MSVRSSVAWCPGLKECGDPFERGQNDGVAQGLSGEHRDAGEPRVAAHQPQHDGHRLADGRQKGEESHQGAASGEKPPGPGQLAGRDAQPGDPLGASERPDPVAGHASQRIARRCGDETPRRIEPHADQNDHHRFGAERQDASGHQRRDEEAPVAPVDEELRDGFHDRRKADSFR